MSRNAIRNLLFCGDKIFTEKRQKYAFYACTIIALYHTPHKRELKIDNAASSKTRCQYISTGKSFLEFDCFHNHLKLVLVTCK